MNYIDWKNKDVSKDLIMCMGIMLYSVWAAEIVSYRLAETMESFKLKRTLVQEKKQALNKARRMLQDVQRNLEIAFDENFNNISDKQSGFMDAIQENANDILKLLLIYFSRGDADWEKKDRMKIALMNFKPSDEDYNMVDLMKYFNLQ